MSLISIGLSGLSATQTALNTIGNNIANADTAGYSRQNTISTAGALQSIGGAGYVGTGTTLSEVRRIYNQYLQNQVSSSTSLDSEAQAYSTQISSLDSLLSDSTTGITSVLSNFYSALQTVSATPADAAARQNVLTQASTLSNRFNSISQQLTQQNTGINTQLTTLTGQVNQLSSSIATLNKQIAQASTSGSPTSLLDARDEAVRQLNELVGVTVQVSGTAYDITLGTGQPLVSGNTANTLSAQPSTTDPTQYSVTVNYQNSSADVSSVISGGEIGGLLRYRSDVLNPTINALGRMAIVTSDSVNSQLAQGVDANGNFGSALYSSINSDAAISQRSIAASTNSVGSGNLDVSISDSSALTTYDYKVTFTSATAYTVMRSDGTSMGSHDLSDDPAPVIDGFTLALDGNSPSAGDSFKVTPTRNGASTLTTVMTDATQLAMGGALSATSGSGNAGSGTITQPAMTTELDVDGGSATTTLAAAIKTSMPVKMVFDTDSGGAQGYTLYDASGNSIGTGSIVPGQNNDLSISVPLVDASGSAVKDADGNAMSLSYTMTVGGTPASGDSYTVAFNSDGTSDNRNAASLLALQTASTVGTTATNAGSSVTNAYAALIEGVGAMASQASIDTDATAAVLTSATNSRDSVSGVNLDEEAANLVKYQQYYTASSQIIKTAQSIFQTLIGSL